MTLAPRRAPPSPTGRNRPPPSDLTTYVRTKTHPWDVGTTPIRHLSLYLTFIHSLILLSCCVSLLFTSCNCIFLGRTLHCIPLPAFSPLQAVAPGYSDIFTSLSPLRPCPCPSISMPPPTFIVRARVRSTTYIPWTSWDIRRRPDTLAQCCPLRRLRHAILLHPPIAVSSS